MTDVRPISGGVWGCLVGGRPAVVKVGSGVADEAAGLDVLASASERPPVPDVLHVEEGLLVTSQVPGGPRTDRAEEAFGRDLAALHAVAWPVWGGGSSWIGGCRVDAGEHAGATAFYGRRLTDLAHQAGLSKVVAPVVARLDELLAPGAPAPLHGDLWWGNLLWGADGRGWLIDPSVHGGHPEEDLAMLALFGALPARLLGAYHDVRPPADGWEERIELFQLVPLLVHSVLYGGGYRTSAEQVARRYA